MERFKKIPNNVKLLDDGSSFGLKSSHDTTCYGSVIIPSNTNIVHRWKFKNYESSHILIGIHKSPGIEPNKDFYSNRTDPNYSYKCTGEKWSKWSSQKYGATYKHGDIVEMILDLKQATLSYYVNDKDQGTAYKVEQGHDLSYIMAVGVYASGNDKAITILEYTSSDAPQKNNDDNNNANVLQSKVDELERENKKLKDNNSRLEQDILNSVQKISTIEQKKDEEIQSQKEKVTSLESENNSLKKRVYDLENEKKEMEIKMNEMSKEIKDLKIKSIDLSKYETWNCDEILMWILSLEDGRYKPYQDKLRKELNEQELTGQDLNNMDAGDVKDLGVTKFKDKKSLYSSIQQLVNKKQNMNNNNNNNKTYGMSEGSNAAPTAYI